MYSIGCLMLAGIRLGRLLGKLAEDEAGQDVLEYVLLVGGVAVAVAATLILGFEFIVPEILESLCPSIDPLGSGDCIG